MKARRTMMVATALGVWMAWRFVGATLVPVSKIELSIAVITLYRPWLDNVSWWGLMTLNGLSFSRPFIALYYGWDDYMRNFLGVRHLGWVWPLYLIIYGCSLFYGWPHAFTWVYKRSGIWERLGVSYG